MPTTQQPPAPNEPTGPSLEPDDERHDDATARRPDERDERDERIAASLRPVRTPWAVVIRSFAFVRPQLF